MKTRKNKIRKAVAIIYPDKHYSKNNKVKGQYILHKKIKNYISNTKSKIYQRISWISYSPVWRFNKVVKQLVHILTL